MIDFDLHKTFSSDKGELKLQLKATFEKNRINAIYGSSGVGKSSLLRMLAGLMKPDSGYLKVEGEEWYNSKSRLFEKPNRRNVGFLFQDYSLFPNMTVLKNMRYGLDKNEKSEILDRIIEIADLESLLERKPDSLSGGQQQRVALARAIVRKPKLLLLDEPLSALDQTMRQKLQEEILSIHDLIDTTIVLVSHHLPEVFKLADRVYVIEEGKFTKQGTPDDVFLHGTIQEVDVLGEVLTMEEEPNGRVVTVILEGKVIKLNIRD